MPRAMDRHTLFDNCCTIYYYHSPVEAWKYCQIKCCLNEHVIQCLFAHNKSTDILLLNCIIKLYKRQPFHLVGLMKGTEIQILTSFCTTFTVYEKCSDKLRQEYCMYIKKLLWLITWINRKVNENKHRLVPIKFKKGTRTIFKGSSKRKMLNIKISTICATRQN